MSKYWKGVWILFTVVITALLVDAEVRLYRVKRASEEASAKHAAVLSIYENMDKQCEESYSRLLREQLNFSLRMRGEAIKALKQHEEDQRDAIKFLDELGLRLATEK